MKVTLAKSIELLRECIELLRELAELQNGSPLVAYEKEWNTTMEKCWDFINNYKTK